MKRQEYAQMIDDLMDVDLKYREPGKYDEVIQKYRIWRNQDNKAYFQEAEDAGYQAYLDGKELHECPYPQYATESTVRWRHGWQKASQKGAL